MSKEPERSPAGSRLFRYENRVPGADELSGGDHDLIVAVSDHIDRHLGSDAIVIHELLSPAVHVDLIPSPATDERPFTVVTTCGMAELPMRTPDDDDVRDLTHAELFVLLPPDWPLDEASMQDERHWWPLRLLKTLARFPHEFDAWLWTGHTVPNDDPPEPYAEGTGLCGALIMPPMLVPDGFEVLDRPDAAPIHFLMVMPLHADEMQLKLDRGLEALYDRFDDANLDPVIDPGRPSVVGRKRRRFGLF